MEKAIIYCRVSTEEQAQEGHHSLSAQESICRKIALEKGLCITRIFRDPGKSATNMNRPGLQDALALCQSDHSIKALLVQDTDRLARNTQDHLAIRAILRKRGVKLISASQPMLEDSAEGKMIDTIIASVNQFQSDITSRKTEKGLEEKVRQGGWPTKAPLGYLNIGKGEGSRERVVVPDPDKAALVQKMFKLYSTGNYSMFELQDLLYEEGLRSKTGKRLQLSKIYSTLQNPFYIGIVRWRDIEVTGQHRPLVEEPLFDAVQSVLRANGGNSRGRRRKHDFLLRGFAFCAKSGRPLIGEYHSNGRGTYYHYYRCHKRGGCCPGVPMKTLEEEVARKFSEMTLPDELRGMIIKALKARIAKEEEPLKSEAAGIQNQKANLETQRAILEQKWLERIISDEDFSRMRKQLDYQIKALVDKTKNLEWRKHTNIDEVEEVLQFTGDLGDSYLTAHPQVRRMLLGFAWERLEVRDGEIVWAVPTPIVRALEEAAKASAITHKPVLWERASVPGGDCHPSQQLTDVAKFRLATGRGD